MAVNRDKSSFILGECKFKNSAFDLSELNASTTKFIPKKATAKIYYYLFSKNGFTSDAMKTAKEKGIEMISIDDML